jgi:hypothetical protein
MVHIHNFFCTNAAYVDWCISTHVVLQDSHIYAYTLFCIFKCLRTVHYSLWYVYIYTIFSAPMLCTYCTNVGSTMFLVCFFSRRILCNTLFPHSELCLRILFCRICKFTPRIGRHKFLISHPHNRSASLPPYLYVVTVVGVVIFGLLLCVTA